MNVGEVLNYLNEIAPFTYAEEWDNVGLMVGSRINKVKKLLLCMDVTSVVIQEAIQENVDLIVSHHPFLFSKLKRLDFDSIKGKQIETLIKNNIGVVSAHTNLDVAEKGVNDTLAETLGLMECKKLKAYIPEGYEIDLGLGKVGLLQTQTPFNEFVSSIKKKLGVLNVRIIGPQPDMVKKVAVFCGSFDDELDVVIGHTPDVLVTGDLKYHTASDAREMGLCIIDVGHFASEKPILNKLKEMLTKHRGIEVTCSKMESDPFIFA